MNKKIIIFLTILLSVIAVFVVAIWGSEREPQLSYIQNIEFVVAAEDQKYYDNQEKVLKLGELISDKKLTYQLRVKINPTKYFDASGTRINASSNYITKIDYDKTFKDLLITLHFDGALLEVEAITITLEVKAGKGTASDKINLNYQKDGSEIIT